MITPERFLELVQAQDPGARITGSDIDGDYTNVTVTLSNDGRLTYLIDVSYGEALDLVIEAQDPDANSTDAFDIDDPDDETEMTEVIEDGIRWAVKWDED